MGKIMNSLGRGIDNVSEWLGRIFAYAAIVTMFVVLSNVIARYVFARPLTWAWDVNTYLFGFLVFLGAGYHVLHRQYITVDVIYTRMPPRIKAIASLIAFLVALLFCYIVISEGTSMALRSISRLERASSAWGPIVYPLRALVPIGGVLLIVQYTRNFVSDFSTLIRGKEIEGLGDVVSAEDVGITVETDEPTSELEGEENNGN